MREARRVAGIWLACVVCLALPVRAQTPEQPNLIFTISGGLLTGGDFWSVPRQLALSSQIGSLNVWDTVSLGRKLRSGFLATLAATYFRSPHLGYSFEAGFFGLESVSSCEPVGQFNPTPENQNARACSYLQGQNQRGDAVGLLAGLIYRFTTRGPQPYIRVAGGGAILGSSYVEAVAPVLVSGGTVSPVYFLADQNHKELTWMVSLGAGAMLPLAPGYQLRVEAREIIVALPRPSGPATDTGAVAAGGGTLPQPPVGLKVMRVPTLSIGLDVVLERRRGRRY
jgi:hypothetical protein